jgi:O-antigen/teichoic acid export membrane protein
MAQNEELKVLKFSLLVAALVSLVYGLTYFLAPSMLVTLSGGDPINFGWVRWAGGVLIALGICTLMVYNKPEKQGIFVLSIALAYLLAGLGLLYSWIRHEYSGATWFIAFATCLTLVLSVLLFWGRSKAKGIL